MSKLYQFKKTAPFHIYFCNSLVLHWYIRKTGMKIPALKEPISTRKKSFVDTRDLFHHLLTPNSRMKKYLARSFYYSINGDFSVAKMCTLPCTHVSKCSSNLLAQKLPLEASKSVFFNLFWFMVPCPVRLKKWFTWLT